MLWLEQIQNLFRQLLPTGRAFRLPVNGYGDKLNKALSLSENKAWTDALSTFDSAIPDNINGTFTHADATDWERRLGLVQYSPDAYTLVPQHFPHPPIQVPTQPPLATRIQAILQQYNYPGPILARGFWKYIQDQLRLAGFDVYVYENRFFVGGNWVTKTPFQVGGGGLVEEQHGDFQHGDGVHGGVWGKLIANSVINSIDQQFFVSPNLRSTFFIGGATVGSWAYVPSEQEEQFRQLVLKLKPVQTVAYLFVIYN